MAPKYEFTVCPVCGAQRDAHVAASDDFNEFWDFSCGASIVLLPSGVLDANEQCGNSRPLDTVVRQINAEYAKHLFE